MKATHRGSCLCGEVRFEVQAEFDKFFLCHCTRCRKDTGSAHAANLFATGAAISWLSGKRYVKAFKLPSTRHMKSFCSLCGSALPSVQMEGELLVVPAGCLDGGLHREPLAHLCWASRADWDDGFADVPRLDGLPGEAGPGRD